MPREATRTGDSGAYLTLESFRPPLYGWFMHGWSWLHGSLAGLPTLQLVLLLGVIALFAVQLGLLLRNALVSIAVVPLVLAQPGIYDAPNWMMTESLFLALILCGLAMQFRHAREPRSGHQRALIAAAFLFGLATITRSTGIIFLLLPLGVAFLEGGQLAAGTPAGWQPHRKSTFLARLRKMFTAGLASAFPPALAAILVMLTAMGWHERQHGHFEIGSWSGISLLTKGLLLVTPQDVAGMPPPIRAVLPYAEKDRVLIAAQPDLAARLRAQVQATSSDLRWSVFIPDAAKTWPAWQQADWRMRGLLADDVAKTLIRRHPLGAVSLWVNDWLSLVLQPAYWPASLSATVPDRQAFIACSQDRNCWALERYDLPLFSRIVLLAVSIVGPVAALLVIGLGGWQMLHRRADSMTILFVLIALVVHASLLLSSAFEAGHVRYTVALHVLELPLLIWSAFRVFRWFLDGPGKRNSPLSGTGLLES